MLYFVQSGAFIKIGKSSNFVNRWKQIKTTCPEDCRLLLAIHTANDLEAEKHLQALLKKFRRNGEWFEVPFSKAFMVLVKSGLVRDHEPPKSRQKRLPFPDVPMMHSEFRKWYLGYDWRIANPNAKSPSELTPEDIQEIDAHISDHWADFHSTFEKELKKHGTVEKAIAASQSASQEEVTAFWSGLRGTISADKNPPK